MVGELHKAGYQQLRIAAGMDRTRAHWECHITYAGNVGANGWEPIDRAANVAHYSTEHSDHYFRWTDAPAKNARQLAQMFIDRFPRLVGSSIGKDWVYVGWYQQMLGAAERGALPIFFVGDSVFSNPECGSPPSAQLASSYVGLPAANASIAEIDEFSRRYDGYQLNTRTVEACADIAETVERVGLANSSVEQICTMMFFFQRRAKWNDRPLSSTELRLCREGIEVIRNRQMRP